MFTDHALLAKSQEPLSPYVFSALRSPLLVMKMQRCAWSPTRLYRMLKFKIEYQTMQGSQSGVCYISDNSPFTSCFLTDEARYRFRATAPEP